MRYADIAVGDALTPLVKRPTRIQLFRFSAITWNPHRIHFDPGYAQSEGYDDIIVQSHLHGCFLAEMVRAWAGPDARLVRFAWQNRAVALPGDELTCTGSVTHRQHDGVVGLVTCQLEERNQDAQLCAPGEAVVAFPLDEGDG